MNVTIIGGGFAGLCCATRLAGEGHHVTLLEERSHLGGRAFPVADEAGGLLREPAPHLFFGYWRAARAFLDRIGTSHKLHLQPRLDLAFVDRARERRKESVLRARDLRLPAPFGRLGRLGGLAAFGALSFLERALALRVIAALEAPSRLAPAARDGQTVDEWLAQLSQSQGARRALWYPLALATLQDEPRGASARMFESALRAVLLGSPEDGCVAAAPTDAQQLYCDDALAFLQAHGATVRLRATVTRIRIRPVRDRLLLDGVELAGGEVVASDAVIAALPPARLLHLLPDEVRSAEPYFTSMLRLRTAPLLTLHVRLDRVVSAHDTVALLGSPFHWIFHRRLAAADQGRAGSEVWLQAWGARDLIDRDDEDLLRLGESELRGAFAEAEPARVVGARVVRERDALLAHPAGSDADRPKSRTPVEGLFLAGDFVRTGLPANLESAARSADDAATMALEFEPPPPPPSPKGFVPIDRLLRRSTTPN